MLYYVFRERITAKIPLFPETPKPFRENVVVDASFCADVGFFDLLLPYLYIDNVLSMILSSAYAFKAVFSVFRQELCAHTEWLYFAVCAHTNLDTHQQNRLFS